MPVTLRAQVPRWHRRNYRFGARVPRRWRDAVPEEGGAGAGEGRGRGGAGPGGGARRGGPPDPAQAKWPYTYVRAGPPRPPANLPAEATSFVGRRRELAEVRKKLTEARLVSLVGPGGGGKTRLAIRAATELGRGVRGGGWLVELAQVLDPALVSHAVMAALDLPHQAAPEPL